MAGGHSNREIAEALNLHYETIKNHVSQIMGKLNAKNRTHAVMIMLRQKEVAMPEKNLTRNLTLLIKGIDKLIQDVERDVRQITDNVHEVKDNIGDIKHKLTHLEDEQEGDT